MGPSACFPSEGTCHISLPGCPADYKSTEAELSILWKRHWLFLPYTKDQLDWLLQASDDWPIACASFSGTIDNYYPNNPLLQFAAVHPFVFPRVTATQPLDRAPLVFTDGSANGTTAYVIDGSPTSCSFPYTSAQLVEFYAIIKVFQELHSQPFNLYTDSAYAAHSVPLLETVPFIKSSTIASPLFCLTPSPSHWG